VDRIVLVVGVARELDFLARRTVQLQLQIRGADRLLRDRMLTTLGRLLPFFLEEQRWTTGCGTRGGTALPGTARTRRRRLRAHTGTRECRGYDQHDCNAYPM
jgi:hypothetical protein